MKTSEIEEIANSTCSGPCVGTGIGYQIVHAPCPESGNADVKARVRDTAKSKAYANSQTPCEGEYCECYGEYHALIPEQCMPIKDADDRDVCLYFAAYAYEGKCTTVI